MCKAYVNHKEKLKEETLKSDSFLIFSHYYMTLNEHLRDVET